MKRFITIDNNGNILNTVESNDPNLIPAEGTKLLEIEDANQWRGIKERPRHFYAQGGKVQEKNKAEKDLEDEKMRPPKQVSFDKRIDDLEKIISIMQQDIEKLKRK